MFRFFIRRGRSVRQQCMISVCLVMLLLLSGCSYRKGSDDHRLDDEALRRGYQATDYLPKRIDNYFEGMDGIVQVAGGGSSSTGFVSQLVDKSAPPAFTLVDPVDNDWEKLGRNTWMMWAGGNEGFWDWLSTTYGFIDLLKLVKTPREQRFAYGGLINEPGMERRGPDRFGLTLDVPTDPKIAAWREQYIRRAFRLDGTCSAAPGNASSGSYAPASTAAAYPAPGPTYPSHPPGTPAQGTDVHYTGYGLWDSGSKDIPPPEVYGLSSGVVGLRLFPNPNFDEEACRKWSLKGTTIRRRANANLVRPYRVGMACAFCHASWHPLNPPADMDRPQWANISGNIGAQYLQGARRVRQSAREGQLHLPPARQPAAGDHRHFAHRVGQHQQPEHDERGVQPGARVPRSPSATSARNRGRVRRGRRCTAIPIASGPTASGSTESTTPPSPTPCRSASRISFQHAGLIDRGQPRQARRNRPPGLAHPARRRRLDRRVGRAGARLS